MDAALDALYARARDAMARDEFDRRVERARAQFDGLLDDEALALLVLDEAGLNEGAFVTIDALGGRSEATVRCVVDAVHPPREFTRKSGGTGRVANCDVSDATGSARLVLWDRDVEKTEDGTLAPGANVTLVNARVKDSAWGVELHVARWTAVEVEGALDPAAKKLLMDVQEAADPLALALRGSESGAERTPPRPRPAPGPLRGTLAARGDTRTVAAPDGAVRFACDLDVDAPEGRVRVVAWDRAVKAALRVEVGAPVEIDGLVAKPKGAEMAWHTTDATTVRAVDAGTP